MTAPDQRADLDTTYSPPSEALDATVCVDCGRRRDQAPKVTCELAEWHDTGDDTPPVPKPEVHAGLDLERIAYVAMALHATWCPTAGHGCTYAARDLQVALDASVAVRG